MQREEGSILSKVAKPMAATALLHVYHAVAHSNVGCDSHDRRGPPSEASNLQATHTQTHAHTHTLLHTNTPASRSQHCSDSAVLFARPC